MWLLSHSVFPNLVYFAKHVNCDGLHCLPLYGGAPGIYWKDNKPLLIVNFNIFYTKFGYN